MNIGLLLYPGCIASGLLALADIFKAVNLRLHKPQFEVNWLTLSGEMFEVGNGVSIATNKLSDANLGALVVPGAWRDATTVVTAQDNALVAALSKLPDQVTLLSYCTGVCLVAEAGKLTGQAATTTWWLAETAADRFPSVRWKPASTVVMNARNATAAGVNGYLPLGMALIEQHCGRRVAEEIQKYMVLPRFKERHTPFQGIPGLLQQGPFMRAVALWVEQCPAVALTTEALADHLNLSSRTLARRIKRETGYSSGQLMRLIKHNQVSDELIATSKSIYRISDELGFADDATLRRSFKQLTGVTPSEYRQRFE
ncbi:helix-turn-helix domain-containing protein [Hahella aquimaris]|uniref:GlxA family transcriptional regulator n=1 Tax=Hahella sp. HNIBRBA332 TaxID=3015983 RepID=UPI00273A89E8|nr:helix-turn-helix domain-containing protein [Hahella sp. HNIBRBA332]WLQ13567.1 helix-turn-helix domain-containing protein [Hahella sp. HNIBRBA332]